MHTRLVQYKFNSNIQIYHSLFPISANMLYLCIECLCLYIVGHITHQAVKQIEYPAFTNSCSFLWEIPLNSCRMLLCTKYRKNKANKSWYLTLMFSKTHVSSIFSMCVSIFLNWVKITVLHFESTSFLFVYTNITIAL